MPFKITLSFKMSKSIVWLLFDLFSPGMIGGHSLESE